MNTQLRHYAVHLPDDGLDESVLVVRDHNSPPLWHLQVRSDALPGGEAQFESYVVSQQIAAGAVIEAREDKSADGIGRIIWRLHLEALPSFRFEDRRASSRTTLSATPASLTALRRSRSAQRT